MSAGPDERVPDAAFEALGVAEDPLGFADPVAFAAAMAQASIAAAARPTAVTAAILRFAASTTSALAAAARRAVGDMTPGPVAPDPKDRRFADVAFDENPVYFMAEQSYLLLRRLGEELLDVAALPPADDRKARFGLGLLLDALAPTNTLLGNPAAMRRAFDSGGKSVARGLRNLAADLRHNGGWPSQVDRTPFEVGTNMAATPGQVVFRNDLIELIQYSAQTPSVYSTPLLFCPPWINKYYILDLSPGKSLVEWAVQHGHTCFAISYRNPDETTDLSFEDYLFEGTLTAIDVVREIVGAPSVNLLSLCLGGTLSAIGLSWLALNNERSVNSATFLNSHTDFSEPGLLGTFTDEMTIRRLEKRMATRGYLEASDMSHTFDLLRANDLVFNYVANNWLLGEKPPAFDLLAWNADATRMPARMHSRYLRSCYLDNELARGEFELDGQKLDLGAVDVDAYVLSAVDDHIVPWTSAYRTAHLLGGTNRFVLSTSGHIAGIVNPPGPKARYWINETLPSEAEAWRGGAELVDGTWWDDWARWIGARAGRRRPARRRLGSDEHPPLEAAPGSYVRT